MPSRRVFLSSTLAAPAAALCTFSGYAGAGFLEALRTYPGVPEDLAHDEDFWIFAQQAFTMDRSLTNLNNGGVSPSPRIVQEAVKRHLDMANAFPPPHVLWQTAPPLREAIRSRLARAWGVDPEELAITRNSSESLQICQFGLDLKPGDEVLTTTHDYPRMLDTFRQRERREGIRLVMFPLPVPCEDADEIVRLFESRITPRTRAILCCHVVNITGQVLPIAAIARLGRSRGIPVIVDGAHAFAHLDFRLDELDCDYYATSLHKWLFAPIGTGLLYVRRPLIAGLWPLMAAPESKIDDIRKFEEIGTHPAANFLGIAEALTFHEALGSARKEARMRALRNHWISRLETIPGFHLLSPRTPELSCGLGVFRIDGLHSPALVSWLWEKHRILTTGIRHDEFEGVRITPSVYTTLDELDRFAELVAHAARHGIPG
ncbi:MAG: aminotransferase class V-fold PLP-dependent enzyme [Phycisphaeraceae bacterium]|nr:aminotransferase class V-fold PLP-dependent enzyme [Phycisphaeraceae bacterium]MCW5754256.1 aminotransferase class V-fold PLP-dependent enzyme [Phycisphaeraceae bacterium]